MRKEKSNNENDSKTQHSHKEHSTKVPNKISLLTATRKTQYNRSHQWVGYGGHWSIGGLYFDTWVFMENRATSQGIFGTTTRHNDDNAWNFSDHQQDNLLSIQTTQMCMKVRQTCNCHSTEWDEIVLASTRRKHTMVEATAWFCFHTRWKIVLQYTGGNKLRHVQIRKWNSPLHLP